MNHVALHFEYPSSLLGRAVQLKQLWGGLRYWQFSHAYATLANGTIIEQALGQTTIGCAIRETKGITIPVLVSATDFEATERALKTYATYGEFSVSPPTSNCTLFVCRSLRLPPYEYPAQLFDYALRHSSYCGGRTGNAPVIDTAQRFDNSQH